MAAVKRLPALYVSVEFIFMSFRIINSSVELGNHSRVTDEA